jgi:ATP-binding cassette, subfamily B, multidrug efflux pump
MFSDLPITRIKHLFRRAGLKKWVFTGLISSMLLVLVEMGLSACLQTLVQGLMGGEADKQQLLSAVFIVLVVSLVLARAVTLFANLFCNEAIREKISLYLRNHWVRLALLTSFGNIELSKLSTQLNETIYKAGSYFASLMQLILQLLSAILYGSACLYFSPNLFGLALVLLMFTAVLVRIIASQTTRIGNKRLELMRTVNEGLLRAKENHKYLKVLRMEGHEIQAISETLLNYYRYSRKAVAYYVLANVSPHALGYLTVVVVLLIGVATEMTYNSVIFIYILLRFSQSLAQGAAAISNLRTLETSFREACDFQDYDEPLLVAPRVQGQAIKTLDLSIKHILYPKRDEALISNLQVLIRAGESLAIIGPSGCGKSTFLDSILKLYPRVQGQNWINGKDWFLDDYCHQIAYVTSEPYLIKGSISENLLYGNFRAKLEDDGELMRAIVGACLDDVVLSSKDLRDIILSEGGQGLSSGQRQRISIARALLRQPRLLVLDEATSNLDAPIEKKIWQNIKNLLPDALIIMVTHRADFASKADYVLDFGNSPRILKKGEPRL